jgi:hypothetical protein
MWNSTVKAVVSSLGGRHPSPSQLPPMFPWLRESPVSVHPAAAQQFSVHVAWTVKCSCTHLVTCSKGPCGGWSTPHLLSKECGVLLQKLELFLHAIDHVILPHFSLFCPFHLCFCLVCCSPGDCDVIFHLLVVRFNVLKSGHVPAGPQGDQDGPPLRHPMSQRSCRLFTTREES